MKKAKVAHPLSVNCCSLCRLPLDDSQRLGEKRTLEDVTIHYFCALFASGLCQNGDRETDGIWGFLLPDIRQEAKRAHRLTCVFCKEDGASVGCLVKSCRFAFHFPCGLKNNVLNQYYGSFSSYCEKHRPRQEAPEKRPPLRAVDTCAVCLCDIAPEPSVGVLVAPCCQNSYIHRECVQRQALSSGLHFFKCPLCNNKDLFTEEMKKFGIYIPDQDASWEQEENAFGDLLERHCSCDIKECTCKFGRNFNEIDSCWEIMLCDSCGSEGTHLACSGLKTPIDDWVCGSCNALFPKVSKENVKKSRQKRKHSSVPGSPSSSSCGGHRGPSSLETPGSQCQSHSSLSALNVLTLSSTPNQPPVDAPYKPRPRCLSRYIRRHKTVRGPVPENRPRWVKTLLSDDIHTGRNLGVKLSFMLTSENELQE